MASTTLITFMVRCPPTARCVSLMGSWDNFKTPYPMKRDSRIGPEHWSGCHNFSNIICDGKNFSDVQPREGGLKMGGTYWYFYKLDDDIEFHNSVEPSTTQCPLLPGQLINELHVPVVLSGNRSRNDSVSSTSSDQCTMNPLDKFINPRPVPKPTLSRLKTSPPLAQNVWSSSNTPASSQSGRSGRSGTSASAVSEPGSANTVRILRGSRKPSFELPSRSGSRSNSPGSALSNGLRSAFRSLRSPRPASPDTAPGTRNVSLDRYLERTERGLSEGYDLRHPRSLGTSRDPSPSSQNRSTTDQDLVFRKLTASPDGSVESVIPQSFQQHRRQRSTSREPSSLRNSLTLEDTDAAPVRDVGYPSKQPLSTLKEVASAQNTPGLPIVGARTADLEKRLPTLPNSPSSAYPPSAVEEDQADRVGQADLAEGRSLEIDNSQSHFSTTTIDTSSSVHSPNDDHSHYSSAWSSEYPDTARSSAYATSFIDDEPTSALFGAGVITPRREQSPRDDGDTDFEETPPRDYPRRDDSIPTVLTSSAVSSTTVSSLATSPSDYTPSEDNWRYFSDKHAPERSYYQRYRLPSYAHGSEVTLKQPGAESVVQDNRPPLVSDFGVARGQSSSNAQSDLPHSNNMQHLIDELSYLGDMIHQK